MKAGYPIIRSQLRRNSGLVLVELLVLAAVIAVVFALVLPMFHRPRSSAPRIKCASNLKQVALAMKMYAGDFGGRMPWHEFAVNSTNVQTVARHSGVWRYMLMVSNELGSTKILVCPADAQRLPHWADAFAGTPQSLSMRHKRNEAVSYFINPNGDETMPNQLMLGDRHITPDGKPALYQSLGNQLAEVNTNKSQWRQPPNKEFHEHGGNYALYDGSVQQASTDRLRGALKLARDSYGTNANRFLFPQ